MSREIVLAIDAVADAASIYDAVTTQEGLASFWTSDVSAAASVGAQLRFGFEPAPVDLMLTVADLTPETRVVWEAGDDAWPDWQGTTMTWRLGDAPGEADTRVIFRHGGWADDYADGEFGSVAYTWALVLGALKDYVESGAPRPALG